MSTSSFGRIYKRKGRKGYWLRIREEGREVTCRGGTTKKEAQAKLDSIREKRFREKVLGERPVERIKFDAWVKLYLEQAPSTFTANTVKEYSSKLKSVLLPFFKHRIVEDIHREDVERFLASRRGVAPATRNRDLSVLSSVLGRAVAQGYGRENPCAGVRRAREELRPVPFLSLEEQDRLIDACPSNVRLLARVAIESGLRQGELSRLEWRDVDYDRGVMVVRVSKSKRPREVPITDGAAEALAQMRKARDVVPLEGADRVIGAKEPDWRLFKKAATIVGHPELCWHDMRHLFAVNCVRAGVPLPDLAKILGHASLTMTMRYANHAPENAASRVAAILMSDRRARRMTQEAGA